MAKSSKIKFKDANVVALTGDRIVHWRLGARGAGFELTQRSEEELGIALQEKAVDKGWRQALSPRLNIAWLPPENVYFKVVQLPTTETAEIGDMLELQMESLSPIPVSQLVWSYEIHATRDTETTVILLLIDQRRLDRALDEIEAHGFQCDRLSAPQLSRLWDLDAEEDAVYVFPERNASGIQILVAWFTGGALRFLQNFHSEEDDGWKTRFFRRFRESAWAGEMEGWLETLPPITLVAPEGEIAEWSSELSELADGTLHSKGRADEDALAQANASAIGRGELRSNLLPGDRQAHYRNRFIDSVFLSAAAGALAVYAFCLLVFFGVLKVQEMRRAKVETQIATTAPVYTNALRLNERIKITERQIRMRYLPLDAWKLVVSAVPEELKFLQFNFQKGETLILSGEAPKDADNKITEFVEALRELKNGDTPLFVDVILQSSSTATRNTKRWAIQCLLKPSTES